MKTAPQICRLGRLLFLMMGVSLNGSVPMTVVADESAAPPSEVDRWVDDLSSDSYLRRKRATKELIALGAPAVPTLVAVLDRGDLETIERAITVLSEIAVSQPLLARSSSTAAEPILAASDLAWKELERLSGTGGSRAARATMAIEEIREVRRGQAVERLSSEGVFVGITEFVISARSELKRIVQIDDNFRGPDSSLQLLQWIDEIGYARVKGSAIRKPVLRGVVQMPELRTVSLLQGTIDMESLRVLGDLTAIRHLEFRYVPLSGDMVDYLATLPITVSLTLMGTGAPVENIEALRRALPGLQLDFKQGGFLGVKCLDSNNQCEINEVVSGSAAELAGLMSGDVIIGLDDKPISRFSELQDEINVHLPGDSITIRYQRGGVERTTSARLGKLEES